MCTSLTRRSQFYECMTNTRAIHVRFVVVVFLLIFYSWLSCNWHDLDESRIIERWEYRSIYTHTYICATTTKSIVFSFALTSKPTVVVRRVPHNSLSWSFWREEKKTLLQLNTSSQNFVINGWNEKPEHLSAGSITFLTTISTRTQGWEKIEIKW